MTRPVGMLLVTGWLASMPAAANEVLSLPEALSVALSQNPHQIIQRLETGKAQAVRQQARGARLPTLDFSATATRYGYPALVHGIRERGVFPPLDKTIYDYGVALRLPLYTGGRLSGGVARADLGREIALERERLGRQELTFNVCAVYLKILHLDRLETAYGARIASLESQERRVRLLVDVGRAPRLDALKIAVALAKARHDRLQVRNGRREAYTLLFNLMGREPPAEETPLVGYAAAGDPGWQLAELQRAAQALRPELKIAEREMASGSIEVEIARAERLPDIALVGVYRERAGADTDYFDDWSVGVQLSVPLFDGGVRKSRVEQAMLAAEQARRTAEQQRLEVGRQLQDAWYAYEESRSRLAVTENSVREAGEALAIERLRYEQGVGTVTDLLAAESAALTAQADRLQAEFDLIVAQLGLLRASGQLDAERVLTLVRVQGGTATEQP